MNRSQNFTQRGMYVAGEAARKARAARIARETTEHYNRLEAAQREASKNKETS